MSPDRVRSPFTVWLLIFMQLLTPALAAFPAPARAAMSSDMPGTVQGLDALIRGQAAERSGYQEAGATPSGSGVTPSAPAEGGVVLPAGRDGQPTGSGLPDLSWPEKGMPGEGGALPKMQEDKPADTRSGALASGAMQAGSLLSGDDRTDAAINYAKGIGEGLINQKVNDWLNQFGNAKISLGTDGQFSGDMLIPLHDTDRNLLFTQLGARRGQERNLVNVGAGYRAYTDDWMLGGNVFYDYDYTGKNRRLGVGGELWRDYLKLSANGYFRLTNWHQSVLSEMEDYDERPANGFDIRAEGYLPAWPHLGGSLKYEQYFGKGVSVADGTSPDTLKDSPVVLTAGLSYTPFPLMTLSASRAVGDSNDTRLALDLSYRLGVPWSEQVSPGSVDLMRSLAGNKYDFVDRNYNIVMQYRKQELLRIQLPERRTAQAAETLTIPLTVSRAKYGLKGVNWAVSPELTARGGRYRIVSPTEIQVTLPAYIFTGDQKATQTYRVSAVATDGHGNRSDTATMLIDVVPSENTVSHLTVSPGDRSVPANDTESYTITGTVTDGKGAPLVNQKVTFAVEGLINTAGQAGTTLAPVGGGKGDGRQLTAATGTDGKATIILRSKVAGEGKITATMDNGNSSAAKVTFVADSATASVRKVTLKDDTTAKPADGKNAFTYTALVKDKYDNTLANAPVSWAVDAAGVTLSAPTTQTDSNGKATVKLLSGTRVVTDITVSAHSAAQAADIDADKKVSFTAGNIAPDKSTLVASPDSITANGQAASTLTLTLVDVNNNPVTGAAGSLHASVAGLDNVSVGNFAEQGATGVYVATLTGTRAGIATITALSGSKKASTQTPTVTFSADKTTVQIKDMTIAPDGAAADGKAANGVKVTVTDKQGNPVPEVTVTFSVNGGATLTTVNGVSDANGVATTTVTSTTAGRYTVTASVNGQTTTKEMTFVADVATAHVSKVTLVGSTNSLPANGQSRFSYTVTVVDNQGNTVSGVKVTPKADKPGVTATAAGVTDAGGQTTVTLTSSTTAVADITVSARAGDTAAVNADKTVSFIADAASAKVDSLAVTTDNAKADGQDADVVLVRVTDAGNNPVSGRAVVLKADGGAAIVDAVTTDAQGQATATLTSKKAGVNTVTATLGGSSKTATAHFIADASTAKVDTVTLVGTDISKVADGKSAFDYTVTVVDANGNPVSGATVTPKADKAGVTAKVSGATDGSGQTTVTLTSSTTAVADITVSARAGSTASVNADKTVSFIADASTAKVDTVTLVGTDISKVADGKSAFTYTVMVKDGNGNRVSGATVTPKADKPGVTATAAGVTDAGGQTTVTLTSTTAAVADITVSARAGDTAAVNADKAVSFIADASTAKVDTVTLVGTDISKVADGKSAFTYTVMVKDGNGNRVSGATVTPKADKAGVTATAAGVTDAGGQTTVTLTSSTTAVADITVSARAGSTASVNADKTVSFIADAASAQVDTVKLVGNDVSKVADGKNTFTYTVMVKDGNGNRVSGATVTPKADKAGVTAKVSGATDGSGQTTVTLTSSTTAVADITVSVRAGDTAAVNADKAVSFIAGTPAQAQSAIVTDKASYASGDDMAVKVTLKDANGNGVTGASASLTAEAVTVQNATAKADGWTDNGDGTYGRTYAAVTAGTGLKAAVKLKGWSGAATSGAYAITADASTAKVDTVTLVGTDISKVADGKSAFTYTVMVKDGNGNRVSGATVTPKADKPGVTATAAGVTDAGGQTIVTLTSSTTAVADITVSAQTGDTAAVNADKAVSFIADASTAKVDTVTLVGTDISKVADGKSAFTYTVMVKDGNGNRVSGATVTPKADKPGVTATAAGVTDAGGQTTVTLTSTTAAVADITVSARAGSTASVNADKTVSFIADAASAQVDTVKLVGNDVSKVADGKNTFTYTVMVKDGNGNRVSGATVTPKADKAGVTAKVSGATDGSGQTTVTLTSSTTAVADITVSVRAGDTAAVNADKAVSFIADASTAKVDTVTLVGTDISKVADGKSAFDYTVTVVDANGNPVSGATVTPKADKAGVTATAAGVTDAGGQTTVTLTSSTTAVADITVSVRAGDTAAVNADKAVSFIADASTAKVDTVTLVGTDISKVADGKSAFTYTVMVKDGNGNRVSGATVTPKADKAGVTATAAGVTDAGGQTTVTLTSSTTAVADITVSVRAGSTASVNADKTVSFIADASTAKVDTVTLVGTDISKVADGKSAFDYTVTVRDGNGNPVSGATVTPKADKAGVTATAAGVTDAGGQTTVTLTSSTTAVADITVSARAGSTASVNADKTVSFIADAASAQVDTVKLVGNDVSKVADGKNTFTYTVMVKDGNGNRVSGATVTPKADKAGVTAKVSGATDGSGQTTVTLTSSTTAVADITVSVRAGDTAAVNADKAVSFIAGTPAQAQSAIVTDKASYASGDDMAVKVTLKDANGNGVTGASASLTAEAVTVQNATAKADGWTDNGDGTYGRTYAAVTAGTGLKAAVKLKGWSGAATSGAYAITADASTAKVDTVTLVGTDISKVADGKSAFTYTVMVKDGNGNRVSGATVTPKADKPGVTATAAGVTDAGGQTIVTLTSSTTAVADITVSAQTGDTAAVNADKAVSFIADASTAKVDTVTLVGTDISKVADGKSAFTYTVMVKDGNGNRVSGATVTPKADKPGVTATAAGVTDAGGQTTVTLTSTTAAVADITVSARAGSTASVNADKTVSFIADAASAQVDTVKLVGNDVSKVADGKNTFTYTVMVKDGNGNRVSGATVTPKADKAGVTAKVSGATDGSGQTTVTLTSSTTAVADITVSVRAGDTAAVNADKAVSFIADASTAKVDTVTLVGTDISKVADGKSAFDYTVTVVDANGNPVSGATVTPKADKAGVTATAAGVTDAGGQTTVTLTSSTTAVADITVSVRAGDTAAVNADKAVSFIADASTAKVDTVTLVGTDISKVADGKSAFTYTVMVKDGNGNRVSGATVTPKADKAGVTATAAGVTDAGGQTTVTLTSSTTAVADITVSVRAGSTASVNADKTVSFIADASTAKVDTVTLVGTDISKVADGKSAFDYTVTVRDGNGNPVSGATVTPKADKAGVTATAAGVTDAGGQTTVTLTSSTTAVADITVSARAGSTASVNADKTVSFIADAASAQVDTVKLVGNDVSKVADGKNTFTYTVMVKDGNGNRVSGATVTPKADKAGVTAKVSGATDGSGQTTVTLTSSTTAVADITVSVRAGDTAAVNADKAVSFIADASTAKVDTVTLVGTDISKVADGKSAFDYTVTVVDANGNPVSGATVTPKADKAGVTATAAGVTDAGGQTTVTLTSSTTAVADITVSVRAGDTAAVNADKAVSFIAGTPAQAQSTIVTDKNGYVSGDDMLVTVTLKDANGNGVTGASASLTAEAVTVQNATAKADGWTDNGDGTYGRTYAAVTAGTGLKATVKLEGWSGAATSGAYAITEPPELKDITVNGYTFAKDAGFPTTGFTGATFTLNLTSDAASDYTWTSDADWVSVTNGVVKFTKKGTGSKVTITGKRKSGGSGVINYSFTLKGWFISGTGAMTQAEASTYCSSQSYSLPTVAQLSNAKILDIGVRAIGPLWSEWGYISRGYPDSGISSGPFWTSEGGGVGTSSYFYVYMDYGRPSYDLAGSASRQLTLCRQGF